MKKLVIRLLFCVALILPMSFLNAVYGSEQEITTVIGEDDSKSVPPGCDPNRGCIDPYATFLHLNGHIQYTGWVQGGNMSGVGTVGQSLRLEAITLALVRITMDKFQGVLNTKLTYNGKVGNHGNAMDKWPEQQD